MTEFNFFSKHLATILSIKISVKHLSKMFSQKMELYLFHGETECSRKF